MSEIYILTDQPQLVPALVGALVLVLGLCSLVLKERLYLSETMLAMVYGIIIGPYVLNWMDPTGWTSDSHQLTKELSRYALALEVMITGACLPGRYAIKEWRSLLMLLVPAMTVMWLVSSAIIKLTLDIPLLHGLAMGACVAPTDPVLASAILEGTYAERNVPMRLRNALAAESGANDGLGYPFLFFALFLMRFDAGKAMGAWFYATWAYQILLCIAIGVFVGYVCRKAVFYADASEWMDRGPLLASAIALAFVLVGVCTILGTDDILCCFVAGNAYNWDGWFREEIEDAHMQETVMWLLSMAFFVYFGAIIPWAEFADGGVLRRWHIAVIVILVLLLRRLPVMLVSYKLIPAIRNWREALFAGWFGPIGVSAIFYAVVAIEEFEKHSDSHAGNTGDIVFPVVCAIVFGSVLVHGTTVPFMLLGQRARTTFSSKFSLPGK